MKIFHPKQFNQTSRVSCTRVVKNTKGFTLIELLVVIAIIGLLSSVVMASLNAARGKARDAQRQSDIQQVYKAIQLYWLNNNSYPSTGGIDTVYMDPGCPSATAPDVITADWVPGLVVGGYIKQLPRDPRGGYDTAANIQGADACYMYSSDGNSFLLTAWGTVENGPITSGGLYSRAGYRESGWNALNAAYICNHPNIGMVSADYYKHSYTITNLACSW